MFSVFRRAKPAYLPVSNRSGPSTVQIPYLVRHGSPTFISLVLAACLGMFVGYNLLLWKARPDNYIPLPAQHELSETSALGTNPLSPLPYIPPPRTQREKEHLSVEQLRAIVAPTKGFWARDWSLNLGWNNMRFIIEAALLHAALLNRTAVIPTFIYARSCEHEAEACGAFVPTVNHGDAVDSDEWREDPPNDQLSWRVPIELMLNMTLLRSSQPVITVAEYLRLHNIPEELELSNGNWGREAYHLKPDKSGNYTTLAVIPNGHWDPEDTNRIDVIPDDTKRRGGWIWGPKGKGMGLWPSGTRKSSAYLALEAANARILDWDRAHEVLRDGGFEAHIGTDEDMTQFLNDNGWEVLYTFHGAGGEEYMQTVVNPKRDVAPRESLRGVREQFDNFEEDVVLLEGEIHSRRKSGGLRFSTTAHRDIFAKLVLHSVHPTDNVYVLADKLAARMLELNNGRMWLSAHMRRGDFVRTDWVLASSIEAHLNQVKGNLERGRNSLRSLVGSTLHPYDIPGAIVDQSVSQLGAPQDGDKFYIATDERDRGNMQYLTDHGAVLVSSLLTHEDRREFGWALLVTDILGLVEQVVLAKANYFYAHSMSSYAGGTLNMRAAMGQDPRTAVIED